MAARCIEAVALVGLCGVLLGFSSQTALPEQQPWSAALRATVLESAPVFLVPDSGRLPLRVLAVGTSLEILDVRGPWVNVRFADQQFGPRVGFVEGRLIRMPPASGQPETGSPPAQEPAPDAAAAGKAPPAAVPSRPPSPLPAKAKPAPVVKRRY